MLVGGCELRGPSDGDDPAGGGWLARSARMLGGGSDALLGVAAGADAADGAAGARDPADGAGGAGPASPQPASTSFAGAATGGGAPDAPAARASDSIFFTTAEMSTGRPKNPLPSLASSSSTRGTAVPLRPRKTTSIDSDSG